MSWNTLAWNRLRYSLYVPVYDLVTSRIMAASRRRAIEGLALQPGERVLISGCGTGADLDFLPPDIEVSAVDLTPAMVAKTRKRASRLGREADIRVMNAQALAYPDNSFDVVMLHLILAVVPDPTACLREACRVLKPGGRMVIFDKFLADDARAGLLRRSLNQVTDTLFTRINLQLGPLLEPLPLERVRQEPALLDGLFQLVWLRRLPGQL